MIINLVSHEASLRNVLLKLNTQTAAWPHLPTATWTKILSACGTQVKQTGYAQRRYHVLVDPPLFF